MPKYQKGSFITVPNQQELFGMDPQAQCLYMWLCHHANQEGECFPSRALLAAESGMSIDTVKRVTAKLIVSGILKKYERKKGKTNMTNVYEIIIGGVGAVSTPPGAVCTAPQGADSTGELNPSSLTKSTEDLSPLKEEFIEPDDMRQTGVIKKTKANFVNERRAEAGKPPMERREPTEKQAMAINRMKVLSYFQEVGLKHGFEYLLEEDEQANNKFKGLARSLEKRYADRGKAVIDWWFESNEFAWCDYHPSNFFTIGTYMKYDNKHKAKKKGGAYKI